MPLLSVTGLVKTYGRRRVVDGVDFHVEAGEIVGLLGPNGAGKTTSFRMTCGLVMPDAGSVLLDDEEITHWPMFKRSRDGGMGYLAQEQSVFRSAADAGRRGPGGLVCSRSVAAGTLVDQFAESSKNCDC